MKHRWQTRWQAHAGGRLGHGDGSPAGSKKPFCRHWLVMSTQRTYRASRFKRQAERSRSTRHEPKSSFVSEFFCSPSGSGTSHRPAATAVPTGSGHPLAGEALGGEGQAAARAAAPRRSASAPEGPRGRREGRTRPRPGPRRPLAARGGAAAGGSLRPRVSGAVLSPAGRRVGRGAAAPGGGSRAAPLETRSGRFGLFMWGISDSYAETWFLLTLTFLLHDRLHFHFCSLYNL